MIPKIEFTVAQLNAGDKCPSGRVVKWINENPADFYTLQESGRHVEELIDAGLKVYDNYPLGMITPIVVATNKFNVVGQFCYKLSDEAKVGSAGAGPAVLNAKYLNGIHLESNDDFRKGLALSTSHLAPSIQLDTVQRGGEISRDALHEKQVGREIGYLSAIRGARIHTSDWNCRPDHPNVETVFDHHFRYAGSNVPTLDGRNIDWSVMRGNVECIDSRVVEGVVKGSHHGRINTYSL